MSMYLQLSQFQQEMRHHSLLSSKLTSSYFSLTPANLKIQIKKRIAFMKISKTSSGEEMR